MVKYYRIYFNVVKRKRKKTHTILNSTERDTHTYYIFNGLMEGIRTPHTQY